jgi:hypothetical protein
MSEVTGETTPLEGISSMRVEATKLTGGRVTGSGPAWFAQSCQVFWHGAAVASALT